MIHEKQRIAIGLGTNLQADGTSGEVIMREYMSVDDKRAVPALAADNDRSPDDARKDQNALGVRGDDFGVRVLSEQRLQSGVGVVV